MIARGRRWRRLSDCLDCNESCVCVHLYVFLFFFFFSQPALVDFVNCEQCISALFTVPQITLFSNFFLKNGSHSTIYTFKNYFATVFSVLVFSFSKNKLNPSTPWVQRGVHIFVTFLIKHWATRVGFYLFKILNTTRALILRTHWPNGIFGAKSLRGARGIEM